MSIRNILVPVFPALDATAPLTVALQLARRFKAHIDAVFIRSDPAATVATFPEMIIEAGFTPTAIEKQDLAAEAEARERFEAWRSTQSIEAAPLTPAVGAVFARWSSRVGMIEAVLTEKGRLSDLIVLRRPRSFAVVTERAFDAAVFDTARPVLIADEPIAEDLLRHVVLSWNGSLQATRAIAAALPLLKAADRVSIFTAPQYGGNTIADLDVAEALSWHGVSADPLLVKNSESTVGLTLLRAASEQGATMIAMGCYTHSRVRQALLGGVTRDVLKNCTVPVFMTH